LLGTADVAKALGVSEADVLATLEKGELKGKRIGSTWRVTKAALDEYLKA
jgi:excisionase family DNA binding protein